MNKKENMLESGEYYLVLEDILTHKDGKVSVIKKGSLIRVFNKKTAEFSEEGKETVVADIYEYPEPKQIEYFCMNKYSKINFETERSQIVLENSDIMKYLRLIPDEYVSEFNMETEKFNDEISEVNSKYKNIRTYGSFYISISGLILLLAVWISMLSVFREEGRLSSLYFFSGLAVTCYVIYKNVLFKLTEKRRTSLFQAHNRNLYEAYGRFYKKVQTIDCQ